jgi:hypothetical protein
VASLSYSNFFAFEASVSAAVTASCPWNARKVAITNDSSTTQVSLTMGGGTFTLLPTESLAIEFVTNRVVVKTIAGAAGTGAGIRIWFWG